MTSFFHWPPARHANIDPFKGYIPARLESMVQVISPPQLGSLQTPVGGGQCVTFVFRATAWFVFQIGKSPMPLGSLRNDMPPDAIRVQFAEVPPPARLGSVAMPIDLIRLYRPSLGLDTHPHPQTMSDWCFPKVTDWISAEVSGRDFTAISVFLTFLTVLQPQSPPPFSQEPESPLWAGGGANIKYVIFLAQKTYFCDFLVALGFRPYGAVGPRS